MLHELQSRFLGALDADGQGTPPLFRGALGAAGFAAYRNNWLAGTRKALASDYPVIERLVGEHCFAALARDYRRAWPSQSGNLEQFGQHFAAFLDSRYGGGAHAYLADVARLERALDDCLLAPGATALTLDVLASIHESELAGLRLTVHPAVRLLRSRWPLLAVWRMHQDDDETSRVDLAQGGVALVLQRVGAEVLIRTVSAECFELLHALASGVPLAAACASAFGARATQAAGESLAHLFTWGCFSGLQFHASSSTQSGEHP